MIDVGIIILISSRDEIDVKLVSAETMLWIKNESTQVPQIQIDYQENVNTFLKVAQDWEGSSPENDRALMAVSEYDGSGCCWGSIVEALDFVKTNNLNISDSFEGYIY